jgi:hypothetical protein
MLIHLLEHDKPIDDILYVNVGDWIWKSAQSHIQQVEDTLGVKITQIDITDELDKGFQRWGFPSFLNRWCTGVKRDAMRDYLKSKYGERESIWQYIGYCADETTRTDKKLYSSYDVIYPLVEANITTNQALEICKSYGFDFGGVYEHHSHFNCWLCPLQRKAELYEVFKRYPNYWEVLRDMQYQTDGYYYPNETIFDLEKQFWDKSRIELKDKRMKARLKYNKRSKK